LSSAKINALILDILKENFIVPHMIFGYDMTIKNIYILKG